MSVLPTHSGDYAVANVPMYIVLCAFTICLLQQAFQKTHNKTSHYSNANFIHSCVLVLVASQENGQFTVMRCIQHFGQ